jgi:hypothetical protein
MLFGLHAAGQGTDPVTGGTITCNPGDTFDSTTAMCFDPSTDAGEYAGVLTLPVVPVAVAATGVAAVATAAPDYSTLILVGLGIAVVMMFGHGGGGQ